jgi:ANTH domain
MRFTASSSVFFLVATVLVLLDQSKIGAIARKPSRPSRAGPPPRRGPPPSLQRPSNRRRPVDDEDDGGDDYEDEIEDDVLGGFPDDIDDEMENEEESEPVRPSKRRPQPKSSTKSRAPLSPKSPPTSRKRPPPREMDVEEEDEYDDYEARRPPTRKSSSSRRGPPPSRKGPPPRPSKVVPYGRGPPPRRRGPSPTETATATFVKGWTALTSVMPDPSVVREGVASSISTAREATSALSSNLYREVKGLTSSELEQVMLKATRPDDTPVKGKHVERLVAVTYQVSARYDIYDAVLRKLWGKMAEKDWRTTIKALYILHRYSADGAPEHAQTLKARLRELRRTKDPKRKDKYFNSKQLLAGDSRVCTTHSSFSMMYFFHSQLIEHGPDHCCLFLYSKIPTA